MSRWLTSPADLWLALMRRLARLVVRFTVSPPDPGSIGIREDGVCYVLENDLLFDELVLDAACRRHGLPAATVAMRAPGVAERRSVFGVRRYRGFWWRRPDPRPARRLARLIRALETHPETELMLVPVAVFWGRAPAREHSWLKLLFAEQWDIAGRTRRLLTILLHGRNVLVKFGEPIALRTLAAPAGSDARAIRRASRLLRVHFRNERTAVIGPDLSHRRSLVSRILDEATVREAIADEMAATGAPYSRVRAKARLYGWEIAADYSYTAVLFFEKLLTWLWTRLYDGMQVHSLERAKALAGDHELVYVPSHRSHIDYMVLSYVLFKQGLALPYVAAGINLNLPLIGPLLRRGGAFFLRRSFGGNALYTAVFRTYLSTMLSKGYPIEYFIEGTRSRSGRLQPARTGMLSMTVHSYLCNRQRPVAFMPVYFGYEKLVEGQTYIGELRGQPKRKESVLGLMRSLKTLRERFGRVQVSIGEPLRLPELLDEWRPQWRDEQHSLGRRPPWLAGFVEHLGRRILVEINAAAVGNPVNLVSLALLAMPKQAMVERELASQLELYRNLLERPPWLMRDRLPREDPLELIRYVEGLGVVTRREHPIGDVIHMSERQAVLATYFRNNVQHLLALPGLVASCFLNHRSLSEKRIRRLVLLVYPFVAAELRLPWRQRDLGEIIGQTLQAMAELRLLRASRDGRLWSRARAGSPSAVQLLVLAQVMMPTLERYYLLVALLIRNGSGRLRRAELLDLAQRVAERVTLVYELHSPDFFDRRVFSGFLDELRRLGVVRVDGEQRLHFDQALADADEDARQVLGAQLRQSLLQVAALPDDTLLDASAAKDRAAG